MLDDSFQFIGLKRQGRGDPVIISLEEFKRDVDLYIARSAIEEIHITDDGRTVTDEEYNRMYAKLKQSLKVTVADDGALGIELTLKSL